MENHKNSSKVGQQLTMSYLRKRMKEKKVTIRKLVVILGVSEATLIGYFKLKTPMPLGVFYEICGALELLPYLIPAEINKKQMENRIFFN